MDHRSHTISNSNFLKQLKPKTRSNKATLKPLARQFTDCFDRWQDSRLQFCTDADWKKKKKKEHLACDKGYTATSQLQTPAR